MELFETEAVLVGGGRALEAREAHQSGGTPPPRTTCVSEANHRVRARRWDVRASGTDAFEDRGGTFALLVHASWQVRARLSSPPPAGWAPASDDKSPLARGADERMCMARGADCDGTGWCAPETTFLAGVSTRARAAQVRPRHFGLYPVYQMMHVRPTMPAVVPKTVSRLWPDALNSHPPLRSAQAVWTAPPRSARPDPHAPPVRPARHGREGDAERGSGAAGAAS